MGKTDYITPKSPCPYCGHGMDRAFTAGPEEAPPNPGDVSICIRCGAASVFDEQLQFRKPTLQEAAEINADPEAIQAQILIRGMKPSSGDKKEPPDYEKARRH